MVEVTLTNGTVVEVVAFKARVPGTIVIPDYQLSPNDVIVEQLDEEGNVIEND